MSGVRWVVFDYGNVISRPTAALPSIASMLDVELDAFKRVYFAERRRYDEGQSDQDYWNAIAGHFGVEVDASLSEELTKADTDGWLETAPETLRLIDDLDRAGVQLALLSNAPSSFGAAVREQPWIGCFRYLLFSGDLKLAKPDIEIYRTLLKGIDGQPSECVFFDDRQENVDGARAAGMHAKLWAGADSARGTLREHGILPA
jgi:putative hydrolase of the HAD superfamily